MKKRTIGIVSILLVFGCSQTTVEKEQVVETDFLPKASRSYDDTLIKSEQVVVVEEIVFEDSVFSAFRASFERIERSKESNNLFPNRFDYLHKDVFRWGDEGKGVSMYYWNFSNRNQTLSVFFNWLDCFGDNCAMLKVGEETIVNAPTAFALLVNEEWMVYLESSEKIHTDEIVDRLNKVLNIEDWLYVCTKNPNQPTEWISTETR